MNLKKPTVLYPTVVHGVIHGPVRCESIDGSELWLPEGFERFIPRLNSEVEPEMKINARGRSILVDFKPFERNGKTWCVSHLQKKASFFSLLYSPFIFHYGLFWKLQEQKPDGSWVPGTERGIYTRTPGWRWQIPDNVSQGTPWIFSGGRIPGTHLD